MENPILSVIVLTYNQEKTISRAIDSILNQKTEYKFEIVIGEDASPSDNTRLVCEKYAEKYPEIIKLLPKSPNKGVVKNYNDCIDASKGKYIMVCAGDDWWHNENKIQLQLYFLENNNDYVMVYTKSLCYDVKKNITINSIGIGYNNIEELLIQNKIPALTVAFRKEIYNQYRLEINPLEKDWVTEDYSTWIYFEIKGKVKFLDIDTTTYSIMQESLSNIKDDFKRTEFEKKNIEIALFYIKKYNLKVKKSTNDHIMFKYMMRILRLYLMSNKKEYLKELQSLVFRNFGISNTISIKKQIGLYLVALFPSVFKNIVRKDLKIN